MTTPLDDRIQYLNYQRSTQALESFARHYAALAAEVTPDPELVTFAQPFAAELVRRYESLAAYCAEVAEASAEVREHYRARLVVEDVA